MSDSTRRPLRIAIVCYPTTGGSGIVAVELAHSLADRGHEVHVISYAVPVRLDTLRPNIRFHSVHVPEYPLFEYPPYSLALAAQLAEVICRYHIDVLHAHYALPHALSGWMARKIAGRMDMPVVTTLHGTDITIVGKDSSYLPITRFSLEASDKVTVVSHWLCERVQEVVKCRCSCQKIYNFVDTDRFKPHEPVNGSPFSDDDTPVLMHVSNFRPVKRTIDVIEIFLAVRQQMPVKLVLIGDGPDAAACEERVEQSPYREDALFLGPKPDAHRILPYADLFLLPSNAESFGLSALEAQACGVPVLGYEVGGLPEVIKNGETGVLASVEDVEALSQAALSLLRDPDRLTAMKEASRERAVANFQPEPIVDRYENLYWQAIIDLEKQGGAKDVNFQNPCDDLNHLMGHNEH